MLPAILVCVSELFMDSFLFGRASARDSLRPGLWAREVGASMRVLFTLYGYCPLTATP